MSVITAALLFASAILGGGINSVAGGGSFITFPALLFSGVPAIPANATNTVALWPGSLASIPPYRDTLVAQRRTLVSLLLISLLGGLIGAIILLYTPEGIFNKILPYLLLGATLIFALGGTVTQRLRQRFGRGQESGPSVAGTIGLGVVQFVIALYGGFFGGGIGILMLALFTLMEMKDIHTMNALKVLLASCINGIAVVTFVIAGKVVWGPAIVMVVGAILGGYFGATIARRVEPQYIRWFVIAVGLTISVIFFFRS